MISTLEPPRPIDAIYRFNANQFERMFEAGILDEGDGVELIEGEVLQKGRWHNDGPVRYRFSLDQYHRMIAAGILGEDDPVEFYNGEVQPNMPQGKPHAICMEKLMRLLARILPDDVAVRCQLPAVLDQDEPQPDFIVCNSPEERSENHPEIKDVYFAIEIAFSSLSHHRGVKLALYASHRISEYWVVNLVDRQIEVYRDPMPDSGQYEAKIVYSAEELVPIVVQGKTLDQLPVKAVLPK